MISNDERRREQQQQLYAWIRARRWYTDWCLSVRSISGLVGGSRGKGGCGGCKVAVWRRWWTAKGMGASVVVVSWIGVLGAEGCMRLVRCMSR
jgi:hypothetical protein